MKAAAFTNSKRLFSLPLCALSAGAVMTVLPAILLFSSCKSVPSSGASPVPDANTDLTSAPIPPAAGTAPDAVAFPEIWGYVSSRFPQERDPEFPLSDIALFSAEVNCYGTLDPVPPRSLAGDFTGRVHLVTFCESRGTTHLILDPSAGKRDSLIKELAAAAEPFDGLQVDYEQVPSKDGALFLSFLKELKNALHGKMLTVALPARSRTVPDDVYDYQKISPCVDRIIVMAYDQHWSTSAPGAIADLDWAERIADYAEEKIPSQKLVMGLPFYGRTWGDDKTAGRAWYYSTLSIIMKNNEVTNIERNEGGVPHFTFTKELRVTGWYEDAVSLHNLCRLYANKGILSVSFWHMGQEDPLFRQYIKLAGNTSAKTE